MAFFPTVAAMNFTAIEIAPTVVIIFLTVAKNATNRVLKKVPCSRRSPTGPKEELGCKEHSIAGVKMRAPV